MTTDSYTNWNIAAFWYRDQAQSLAQKISKFLISRQAWEFTAIDYIYFPYICTYCVLNVSVEPALDLSNQEV